MRFFSTRLALVCTVGIGAHFFAASAFGVDAEPVNDTVGSRDTARVKPAAQELDRVVVTASRYPQEMHRVVRSVTVVDEKMLGDKNQFSALDALDDEIGVWVEKRTTTSSDPVVRGLSGANVLALVDGNSFTTFWGEGGFAGDDMYGKIDGEAIERIEVVRGPSSVMYGSNALGGVINFIARKPPVGFTSGGFVSGTRLKGASGSASDYLMGRAETWGAGESMRYLVGVTRHRGGDLRVGEDYGYIAPSGGTDWSVDANTELRLTPEQFLSLGVQYMDRPETFRSYRPSQSNRNQRLGITAGYRADDPCAVSDMFELDLYHQYKRDVRSWYAAADLERKVEEGFAWWATWQANLLSTKGLGEHNKLVWGAGYHVDVAESPDDEQFTMKTSWGDQQAAPGTVWHNAGVFVRDDWDIGEWLTLTGSVRYDFFRFVAAEDTFYTMPGSRDTSENRALTDPMESSKHALTGGAGAVFHLGNLVDLAASWTRGYRMSPPSFGFRQTGQGVLVPNGLLDPVTADLFEVSPRLRSGPLDIVVTGYYTLFHNFQQPIHGEYQGDTAIDYNDNGTIEPDERVYVNTANGDAFVTGVELEVELRLGEVVRALDGMRLIGGAMYNYGRMQFPGESEMPLRHTHPPRGIAKLRYDEPSEAGRWWCEVAADIVAKYDQVAPDRLTSDVGYLRNPRDPSSGLYRSYGLPGYTVLDMRAGFRFLEHLTLVLGVENVLDKKYRSAHSRMDASGRNVLVGLEGVFGTPR